MKNFLNLKDIALIVLILVVLIGGGWFAKSNADWKTKYSLEVNLKNALQDSINHYQNKEGEWVAEKLTLQADIETLEGDNINLTENQENLIGRINSIKKEKDVFAAALASQTVVIDSLEQLATNIDTVNNLVEFVATSDTLGYDITIKNVSPSDSTKSPVMAINRLEIPNEVFIEFHWEKEKLHPVSFSMTNSNSMFVINNIDSYVIPELQKDTIKPTGWKKFGNWFKENGKKVGIFLGGVVIGALAISASG